MAAFTTSHYLKFLTFTFLFLKTLAFESTPLFTFADFGKDPKFKPNVTLFGDAKVVSGAYGIQLSGSGSVMYKRPIKLVEGNNNKKPRQFVSFSTYFAFSMPSSNWGGLAFVMVSNGSKGEVFEKFSSGYPLKFKNRRFEVVGVEFSASRGHGSCNVAINAGSSVSAKEINTSFVRRSVEEKLHAWVDYEASSMRLEVRLSQHGNKKPSDPFIWHSIDLSNALKKEEMFVGIMSPLKGSSNDASNKAFIVYSWSFVLRHFPHSLHSEPLDPKVLVKDTKTPKVGKVKVKKGTSDDNCILRVLAAMIFGTGCGALTAFVVLYLWTIFGNRHNPVVPVECSMQPLDNVEYRKVKVVVDRTIEDGKKVDL